MKKKAIVLSITGASGVIYGIRLTEVLLQSNHTVYLIISKWAKRIIKEEAGLNLEKDPAASLKKHFKNSNNLIILNDDDLSEAPASGSSGIKDMVIIPCSMGTMGRIAAGISSSLIERTADVILKERGTLIIVPRETPLNRLHIENMLRLADAGACILPATPAFYHSPSSIRDIIDFVVGKVMDMLGIEHKLFRRWRGV